MASQGSESGTAASSPQDYASPTAGSPGAVPMGKLALPPRSSILSTTANGGPHTKIWTIPPRPKPGRKPKEQTGDEARKEQNRQAQKKFRSKQSDKIQILTDENEGLREIVSRINAANTNLQAQLDSMRQQVQAVEAELLEERAKSKKQAEELQREVKRRKTVKRSTTNVTSPKPGISSTLPSITMAIPEQVTSAGPGESTPPYDDMEIDFTSYNRDPAGDVTDGCGFCSSGGFCVCAADAAKTATTATTHSPPLNLINDLDRSTALAVPATAAMTGPGTCETCQRNPDQARKCQELAAVAKYSPTPPSGSGGTQPSAALGIKTGPDGLLSDDPVRTTPERTSCSEFLAKFRPLIPTSGGTARYRDVFGKLHTYPHLGGETVGTAVAGLSGKGKSAALDIDAAEAAEALASLAKMASP